MHGGFVGFTDVGAVIPVEIRVGVHGLSVLVDGGVQFEGVLFLNGVQERGG